MIFDIKHLSDSDSQCKGLRTSVNSARAMADEAADGSRLSVNVNEMVRSIQDVESQKETDQNPATPSLWASAEPGSVTAQ